MITLPVWAVVFLCLPSATLAVLYIMTGIVSLWDHREAYKDELRAELEAEAYTPVCPCGHDDCSWDPGYIKHRYPELYQDIWGNKTPEEVVFEPNGCWNCEEAILVSNRCIAGYQRDPNEEYYCWDDEEK